MFFLLRVAFWLSIVVILLPSDPAQKADAQVKAAVSPIEALGAAQAAVEDARGFCTRKPEACEIGSQALQTFGQKAQMGSKYLYEFLSDRFGDAHSDKVTGTIAERPGRQTLTPADAGPAWKAPSPPAEHRNVPLPPRKPV